MKNDKIFLYFKLTFFFFSIVFIGYTFFNNFEKIKILFVQEKIELLYIILLLIILQNIISIRNFILIKKKTHKFLEFKLWSYIFFYTAIINEFLFASGHLIRSFELKKYKYTHSEYIALQILIKILDLFINFFILFLLIIFFIKINFFYIFICLTLLILFYYFINLKLNNFIKFFLLFIDKLFKKNFTTKIIYIIDCINDLIDKKNIISILVLTLTLIILNFYVFKLLFIHFVLPETNINIFSYFLFYYFLKQIPFFNNIPGLLEILFSISMHLTGLPFLETLVFQLYLRLLSLIVIFINLIFYFITKKNNEI